jgi:transposase
VIQTPAKHRSRRPQLTDQQVLDCRQAAAAGLTINQLAHDLGVGPWVVKLAVQGRTYRHLPGAITRGHKNFARGSGCPYAKLDERRVLAIRAAVARGESQRALAARHGVSYSALLNAVQGRTWRHLPGALPRGRQHFARGSDSPHAKLDERRVLAIRAAAARGESQRALAARHGVSPSAIRAIVQSRSWRHLAPAQTTIETPSAGPGRRQSDPDPTPEHSRSERTML